MLLVNTSNGNSTGKFQYNIIAQNANGVYPFVARPDTVSRRPDGTINPGGPRPDPVNLATSVGNFLSSNATVDGMPAFAVSGSNQDPRLGPLGFYGGYAPTIPVLPSSPAIFAGTPPVAVDQRGKPRPGNAFRNSFTLGAFEAQSTDLQLSLAANRTALTYGGEITLTATLLYLGQPIPDSPSITLFDNNVQIASLPVNAEGNATFSIKPSVGVHSLTARLQLASLNDVNTTSAVTVIVSKAPITASYDPITRVASATGGMGENLTSQTTFSFQARGSTTFSSTPPQAGPYSVYYSFPGDANHQATTGRALLGHVAVISGESSYEYTTGTPVNGRVRALGVQGEDLGQYVSLSYRRQPAPIGSSPLLTAPSEPGVYEVLYYAFNAPGYIPILPATNIVHYSTNSTFTLLSATADVNLRVTTLTDEDNGIDPALGTGLSLREAMRYANAHPGPDTITFSSGLTGTLTLTSQLPTVSSELEVAGPGARRLTISGGGTVKILESTGTLSLSGLTFAQGSATSGGALSLSGTTTIESCYFIDNVATTTGGAVFYAGQLTVLGSTFENNSAATGGGLSSTANSSQLQLTNSTLAGNSAQTGGGLSHAGTARLLNTTVAFNRATRGGGISVAVFTATTNIINSIIGANTNSTTGAADDYSGQVSNTSGSRNSLVGPGTRNAFSTRPTVIQAPVASLGLLPIADNGGLVRTVKLSPLSPAINSGDNAAASGLVTDQRGASYLRINDSTIDMGAFETLSLGTKVLQLLYTSSNLNVRLTSDKAAPLDVGTFPLTDKLMFGGFGADDSVQVVGTPNNDTLSLDSKVSQQLILNVNGSEVTVVGSAPVQLAGGTGDDTYRFDADGNLGSVSLVETDPGIDTLDFTPTLAGVNVALSLATQQTVNSKLSLKLSSSYSFENVIGGSGNDQLSGNTQNNVLTGNGGNDRLNGGGGNDRLIGGTGNDNYVFSTATTAEADTLVENENEGLDVISFSSLTVPVTLDLGSMDVQTVHTRRSLQLSSDKAIENAIGGAREDTLIGNSLDNSLSGNGGNDRLNGRDGNDSLSGGAGDDTYVFSPATGSERDAITEALGGGRDLLDFSASSNALNVNLSTTTLQPVHSNRTLRLSSGAVIEDVIGGSGDDRLAGNNLANRLTGNSGNDRLTGNGQSDTLLGGPGDDTYLFGRAVGTEADTLIEQAGEGVDLLTFNVADDLTLDLSSTVPQNVHSGRTVQLSSGETIENLYGGTGNDKLTGNALNNLLVGNAGNDMLRGQAGDDALIGSSGDDVYLFTAAASPESDIVSEFADGGIDTLDFSALTTAVTLNLASPDLQAVHLNRSLTLRYGIAIENAIGGAGDDRLSGNALANVLIGNAGNDRLPGNAGEDVIIGGTGQDALAGGLGEDLLIAGSTNYDGDIDRLKQLRSIWSDKSVAYADRVANLRSGAGVPEIKLAAGVSVFNDTARRDSLTGHEDNDWFFASLDDGLVDALADEIVDRLSGAVS